MDKKLARNNRIISVTVKLCYDTELNMTGDKNNMTFEYMRDHLWTIFFVTSIKAKKFSTGDKSVHLLLKRTCCILKGLFAHYLDTDLLINLNYKKRNPCSQL